MALLIQFTDARQSGVTGGFLITARVTRKDATQKVTTSVHAGPTMFTLPADPTWQNADITIEHDDYQPHALTLRWDSSGVISWSDPCTQSSVKGGDHVFSIPLGRIRFAPGQVPPFGKPTGSEKGVYVQQGQGQPQTYGGHSLNLLTVDKLRMLKDLVPARGTMPSCLNPLHPSSDNGWQRLNFEEKKVNTAEEGGFCWLEYGSPDSRPQQPRFLIAVWAPLPSAAIRDRAVDILVFFSPSTAGKSSIYSPSTYPFRDKYPYGALGQVMIDLETKEKFDAKVQPYVHLGYKYLFRPTLLVPMSIASGKPLIIVMPIFPNSAGKHLYQPFNSKAGMYRLLLEIRQFLEREGYNGSSFGFDRFDGKVAPTAGNAPPPPPAFSSVNRPQLTIRSIVVSGYSRASVPLEALFRTDAISATASDFPPALFGADAIEFDNKWQEFWDLDFFLDEADTNIPRARYEMVLRQWLTREFRRLRLCHGDHTLKGVPPDAFFPRIRTLLTSAPFMLKDPALVTRWAADWRDPAARWSALFFSNDFLRAKVADPVFPSFPLTADPPAAIHGFTAQLGFGLASLLRKTP